MLIAFRGRNTAGVLNDAERYHWPVGLATIVCRDNDAMAQPDDVPASKVGELIQNTPDHEVCVIANGGTTQQLLCVITAVKTMGKSIVCLDIQRDGLDEYHF